ncbi:MAG TPA: aldo/keto reductase [Flavobacteriales bacterium]|jgi:aryl-alcohol dehydrogenase-like predicted oxidoreductase|nr:aldo/keto reductase [Flavobacteriales bacterium]
MKYKLLGRTGLRVSELCLGTMSFGTEWGWGAEKKESKKIFDLYANAGGNFLDTANFYTAGTSEKWLSEFMGADRDHFVLATKYTLWEKEGDPNYSGNHKKNMIRTVEESLKRLKTDYIDLLYLHIWDSTTPVEEIMRGLDDLARAGKILHAGISDSPAWIVAKANAIADLRGWTRFNALQLEYSLIERSIEDEHVPMAKSEEMALLPWSPLGAGVLTGKYLPNSGQDAGRVKEDSPKLSKANQRIVKKVLRVARQTGMSPAQVALNWLRGQGENVIPIVGATKESQLKDNLDCIKYELPKSKLNELNALKKTAYTFPHTFLEKDPIKHVIFGGTHDQVARRWRF